MIGRARERKPNREIERERETQSQAGCHGRATERERASSACALFLALTIGALTLAPSTFSTALFVRQQQQHPECGTATVIGKEKRQKSKHKRNGHFVGKNKTMSNRTTATTTAKTAK